MLPKPEKNKKATQSNEQLDLVEVLSKENKVAKKRRLTLILLILTVGVSTGLWIFRTCRYYIDSKTFPKVSINLPQFKTGSIKKFSFGNLNSDITALTNKDGNKWEIYVKTISNSQVPFEYNQSFQDLTKIEDTLGNISKTPVSFNSLTQKNLPLGTEVRELVTNQNNTMELNSLVTVPHVRILYVIKVNGDNLNEAQKNIPLVIERIYWHIMNLTS
jgi:hypothetical protein